MAVLRANIPELVKVDLDHVLFEEQGTWEFDATLEALFEVTTSKKNLEYGQTVGGFGLAGEKTEGESLTMQNPREGYKTTYTHKTYGMYSAITMEAKQDELHGVVSDIPMAMRRGVDATVNYYASRIFSRADNTSEDYITGGDGKALLDASHPLSVSGGTSANKPSSAVDLTETSMWSGIEAYYQMLDDAGKPVRNRPKVLLVPEQNEKKGTELLLSDKTSESANNAINAMRVRTNIDLVVWPYWIGATDSDCWFIVGDKSQWAGGKYPLKFYWRMRPDTEGYNDFLTKDFLYSIVMRFSTGYTDWRFVYGSMGA